MNEAPTSPTTPIAGVQFSLLVPCAARFTVAKSAFLQQRKWTINGGGATTAGPAMVVAFTTGRKYLEASASPARIVPLVTVTVSDADVADGVAPARLVPHVRLDDAVASDPKGGGVTVRCADDADAGFVCLPRSRGGKTSFPTCAEIGDVLKDEL